MHCFYFVMFTRHSIQCFCDLVAFLSNFILSVFGLVALVMIFTHSLQAPIVMLACQQHFLRFGNLFLVIVT